MLSRLVIIITCISLVGVTIVPASSIPCCCKSMHANYRDQIGSSDLRAETGPACCSRTPAKARSCCSTNVVQASCAKGFVRGECPQCRCVQQLQIIALSGYTAIETSVRLSAVTFAAAGHLSAIQPSYMAGIVPEVDCRDIVISLQTCTLRC
jgi:hypothetical protein